MKPRMTAAQLRSGSPSRNTKMARIPVPACHMPTGTPTRRSSKRSFRFVTGPMLREPESPCTRRLASVTLEKASLVRRTPMDQLRGPRAAGQCADLVSCIHLLCGSLIPLAFGSSCREPACGSPAPFLGHLAPSTLPTRQMLPRRRGTRQTDGLPVRTRPRGSPGALWNPHIGDARSSTWRTQWRPAQGCDKRRLHTVRPELVEPSHRHGVTPRTAGHRSLACQVLRPSRLPQSPGDPEHSGQCRPSVPEARASGVHAALPAFLSA